jgi:hypothetical protein
VRSKWTEGGRTLPQGGAQTPDRASWRCLGRLRALPGLSYAMLRRIIRPQQPAIRRISGHIDREASLEREPLPRIEPTQHAQALLSGVVYNLNRLVRLGPPTRGFRQSKAPSNPMSKMSPLWPKKRHQCFASQDSGFSS